MARFFERTADVPVRVKICGITCEEDAQAAVCAGVHAVGFNFHPDSRRYIDVDRAAEIVRTLPPFVTSVGLFVDPDPARVQEVLDATQLDLLQFHGAEEAALCASFGRPYIKAIGVRGPVDIEGLETRYADARALLLDTWVDGRSGGTGQTFDWSLWPDQCALPLVLAGGLTPGNVGAAVRATRPFAVDVSGGVEFAPGKKDPEKVREFIEEVHRVEVA